MSEAWFGVLKWLVRQRRFHAVLMRFVRYGGWLAFIPMRLFDLYPLILTTVGRKTKKPRSIPIVYVPSGDDMIVAAPYSDTGKPPHWYLNLKSEPRASVEIFWRSISVRATEIADERERLERSR